MKFERTCDFFAVIVAIVALTVSVACVPAERTASPCDGVDRSLTNERKLTLAPEIARQLHLASVDVLQSFRADGWSIIYVDTHQTDNVFLFYAHYPLASRYVTMWSGAAVSSEEQAIEDWTLKNAPNIPPKLARCFAWHVTKDRDL